MIKNKDILECVGKKIKKARLDKNFTQNALAEQIEISTDLLRNIENGRNIGSIATLLNLCNALEITTDFLFADLLIHTNKETDCILYSYLQKLPLESRTLLKQIAAYLDETY